jgi:hypothetical protein
MVVKMSGISIWKLQAVGTTRLHRYQFHNFLDDPKTRLTVFWIVLRLRKLRMANFLGGKVQSGYRLCLDNLKFPILDYGRIRTPTNQHPVATNIDRLEVTCIVKINQIWTRIDSLNPLQRRPPRIILDALVKTIIHWSLTSSLMTQIAPTMMNTA